MTDLFNKKERTVAGLMSGTSLDGIDCVVAQFQGSGRETSIRMLASYFEPFSESMREAIRAASMPGTSSVKDISQLNALLARLYARAVMSCIEGASLDLSTVDAVACHGQTIHHVPEPEDFCGEAIASTLQIGDPAVLAGMLGTPVIDHFRAADVAAGGQGAPLVPYFDYVFFTDPVETRGLLNLGGIANLTILPRNAAPSDVLAFDTGPANMVVDDLARALLNWPRDENGDTAAAGRVSEELLSYLLSDAYYERPPPKSTGREHYTDAYIDDLLEKARALSLPPPDILATATELTGRTIHDAAESLVPADLKPDVLITAGGGTHNRFLMRRLAELFAPIPVRSAADYGLDADFKEALCFALLGHEYLNGVQTNMPSVTGSRRPVKLGRITFPP